jgi:hypothetical protein
MKDVELNRGFAGRFSRLEQLIREDGKETRSLIKIIADGYDSLRTDINKLRVGRQRLEERQDRLEVRMSVVELRIADAERTDKVARPKRS